MLLENVFCPQDIGVMKFSSTKCLGGFLESDGDLCGNYFGWWVPRGR
jgi:hypothetical protein